MCAAMAYAVMADPVARLRSYASVVMARMAAVFIVMWCIVMSHIVVAYGLICIYFRRI